MRPRRTVDLESAQGLPVSNQANRLARLQALGVKGQRQGPGLAHQDIPHAPSPFGSNVQATAKAGRIAKIHPARLEARQQIGLSRGARVDPADEIIRPLGPAHVGVVGITHPHTHQANSGARQAIPQGEVARQAESPGAVAHLEQIDPIGTIGNEPRQGGLEIGLSSGRLGDPLIEHDPENMIQGNQASVVVNESHRLPRRITMRVPGDVGQGNGRAVRIEMRRVGYFLTDVVDEFVVPQRSGHAPGFGEERIPHAIAFDDQGIEIGFGPGGAAHFNDQRQRHQGVVAPAHPRGLGILADLEHPIVPGSGFGEHRQGDNLHLPARGLVAHDLLRPVDAAPRAARYRGLREHVVQADPSQGRRLGKPHPHHDARRADQGPGQNRKPKPNPGRQARDVPAPCGIETQGDLLKPGPSALGDQVQTPRAVAGFVIADLDHPLPGQERRGADEPPTLFHGLEALRRRRRAGVPRRTPIRERGPAIPLPFAIRGRRQLGLGQALLEIEGLDIGVRRDAPIVVGPPEHIHPGTQSPGALGVGPHGGLALAHGTVQVQRDTEGPLGFGPATAAGDGQGENKAENEGEIDGDAKRAVIGTVIGADIGTDIGTVIYTVIGAATDALIHAVTDAVTPALNHAIP